MKTDSNQNAPQPTAVAVGSKDVLGRVLVACEFSGTVRDAFAARGWDAWSCDLLPSETPGQHHQGDIFELLENTTWDLMITHWPCTLLCNSGVRWLIGNPKRFREMERSAAYFALLANHSSAKRICAENPIPHKYAKAFMGDYSQIIHPWQHGHGETKATCLWLKNLPKLQP